MRIPFRRLLFLILIFPILLGSGCQTVSPPVTTPTATASATISSAAQTQKSLDLTATPTIPIPACLEVHGQVVVEQVATTFLTHPLDVRIYFPPCYSLSSSRGYPVLYMLHGQASDDGQWERLGLLKAADELILSGAITPMIIVMPYDISWNASPDQSTFGKALIQDLIPYIDATYNTDADRACRAIGGLSRGGNWAVNLGFAYPELFTAIGAHSTPLFYGEVGRITTVMKTRDADKQIPSIYVDVGNKDENLPQVMIFVDLLKEFNISYTFTQFNGYHSEEYWSAHVEDYLSWYSEEFTAGQ